MNMKARKSKINIGKQKQSKTFICILSEVIHSYEKQSSQLSQVIKINDICVIYTYICMYQWNNGIYIYIYI